MYRSVVRGAFKPRNMTIVTFIMSSKSSRSGYEMEAILTISQLGLDTAHFGVSKEENELFVGNILISRFDLSRETHLNPFSKCPGTYQVAGFNLFLLVLLGGTFLTPFASHQVAWHSRGWPCTS